MLKLGQKGPTGFTAQTPRTRAKLDENVDSLVADIKLRLHVTFTEDEEEKMRMLFYSALAWTADDVMAQAVADGYTSEIEGVMV